VTLNGGVSTFSNFFLNLTESSLPVAGTMPGTNFYDAVANIGVVVKSEAVPTGKFDGNGAALFTLNNTPTLVIADKNTPRIDISIGKDSIGNIVGTFDYFGAGVLEARLNQTVPTPLDGSLTALEGNAALLMVKSSAGGNLPVATSTSNQTVSAGLRVRPETS
jgi:hypothetical protein